MHLGGACLGCGQRLLGCRQAGKDRGELAGKGKGELGCQHNLLALPIFSLGRKGSSLQQTGKEMG